tara:strand:+ start:1105 stop:1356 length:252 start_codon:yes stop_codon:yes gene_type:complete
MQKPTTENLGALVRNWKLNPYQLKLASNEMAFLEKYIEYLERQVKDNVVLPAVMNGFYEWHKEKGYITLKRDDFEEYLNSLKK